MEKLLWIDMEMTGLNPEKEVILEVAAIVTDLDFNELGVFEAVFKQPSHILESMDAWNQKHHKESGLIDKVSNGTEPKIIEELLCSFVDKMFLGSGEKPILAGNSIAQDRRFINKYLPQFSEKLHYRMLDVSSWKIIFQKKFNIHLKKSQKHQALEDIRESIEELKYYLGHIKPS